MYACACLCQRLWVCDEIIYLWCDTHTHTHTHIETLISLNNL